MELGSWLSSTFFEKGAFLTDASSDEVILGKGGKIVKEVSQTSEAAFYLKDFFTDQYQIYIPESWIRVSKATLIEAAQSFESPIEIKEVTNQDSIYKQDFKTLKSAFGETLKKVVLVSREEFRVLDPLGAKKKFFIKSLLFGTGLPYGFWSEDYGVMGSTPELLFSSKEEKLKTFALAGTARKGEEEKLLRSQKDRQEHDLVIQDIKEKLTPFCSLVENDETMLTSYKEMIHLKTNIRATLNKEAEIIALASSLSPTAALGGYPKEEGLKFLKQTKYQLLYPERYFGSTFGLITQEIQQFIVSIRNIQWKKDVFVIESGGGVLPVSELEKELKEIELKRNTIKRHYL
jgi:isochorismate synthase EntC